ncbi:uncharacterized protein TRIADDRAFT_56649 [Trichoplax adhaerens]|uniref:Arrestin C-terminal-like domain-containing protein n=1 Tax=Trichoplax adhaerens TaxID=10228 RepID=B3RYR4_TRIAD|nr:hypothetical protein TRIADDRAFT_56649 [Trichoplax adhaerens]EDV25087.1 hypothetical protein TRIADDRAFT_56649 [Trichoplax adhaerens]|eukprot:XP_002112977.1 hypothetical protein TRIADDRAFT_56649 [Trichoplax adhaerens]
MTQDIELQIILDKEHAEYSPGEVIEGSIRVQLRNTMNARAIRLRFRGTACTQVSDGVQSRISVRSKPYIYKEVQVYLDTTISIWGEEDSQPRISNLTLPEGSNEFKFSYQLPTDIALPSSLEGGKDCYIRYNMVAILENPPNDDHQQELAFQVTQQVDIGPTLLQSPSPLQNDISFCCFCFRPGLVKLNASIDRSGYRPGESISLDIKCQNLSNRTIPCLRVRFIGCLAVAAEGHTKTIRTIIQELYTKNEISPCQTYESSNQTIPIPSTPPTSQSLALNVNVTYIFQVAAIIPFSKDLHVDFPIVIGSKSTNMESSNIETTNESRKEEAIAAMAQIALVDSTADESLDIEDDTRCLINS